MEEGTKAKKTVFVGGIGDGIDEAALYEAFSTFGASVSTVLPTFKIYLYSLLKY